MAGTVRCPRCQTAVPSTAFDYGTKRCWNCEETAAQNEYYDREVAAIEGMKAERNAVEAAILARRRTMGTAVFSLDGPEEMDYRRADGHPYSEAVDDLDGMYRALAAQDEAIGRRLHDLGYV